MKTVTIQIGNSDNKLTQLEWSEYTSNVGGAVVRSMCNIHFFGAPPGYEPWQNVAWIVEVKSENLPVLKYELTNIRREYKQDSVAFIVGETEFI